MRAAAKLTKFPPFFPGINSCGAYTYPLTPSVSETWQTGLNTVYVVRLYEERRMALCYWTEISMLVGWFFQRTCSVVNILINCMKRKPLEMINARISLHQGLE